MSEEEQKTPEQQEKDSLGINVKKSPWFVFALLQIPIVIVMVIIIYFMSQYSGSN